MADIKIKNASPEMIAQLDRLVVRLGYSDRSALMKDVLQKYIMLHDDLFLELLPDMTRAMVNDTLKEYPEKLRTLLQYVLEKQEKTDELLMKIAAVFDDI